MCVSPYTRFYFDFGDMTACMPMQLIDQTTEKLKPRPSATCSYLKLNQQNGIEAFDDNSGVIGEVFLLAMGSRATAEATASHSR